MSVGGGTHKCSFSLTRGGGGAVNAPDHAIGGGATMIT